jgi:predicted DNA-binding transcriptional regulator AlpA
MKTAQDVTDQGSALTASQVAGMLGIPRKRVYELDIPAIQLSPRTLRWLPQDVLEWRNKRRVKR